MVTPTVFPDHEAMSRHVADWLEARLRHAPDALLCLAAGSTPTRTYQLLAEKRSHTSGLFDSVRIIKLDEWGGLAMDDPATCEQYLRRTLIDDLAGNPDATSAAVSQTSTVAATNTVNDQVAPAPADDGSVMVDVAVTPDSGASAAAKRRGVAKYVVMAPIARSPPVSP